MGLTRLRAEQISDIDYKQAVRVITVTDITALSGGAPSQVDGVNLSVGDRILVTAQDPGSENGIYQVQTLGTGSNGTWIRSLDTNQTGELEAGTIVMVTEGTVYKDTQWKLTTNNPIIIGTTPLTFELNSAFAFGNIYANGTAVLADSVGDAVIFSAGNNIQITGNNTSKTVTIGVTGLSLNSISNGTSNVNVVSSGGNVTVGVGGTGNITEFSTTGVRVTGITSASGNITGGNLATGGLVTATGNVIGGNVRTAGTVSATGSVFGLELTSTQSSGDEGGQLNLAIPAANTALTGQVTIDVFQNRLRFFQGDNARGAYIDLTQANVGVGTNLLAGGGGGTPGGANTNIQFNDDGVFGGNGQFVYNKVTNIVTAGAFSANTNGAGNNFVVGDDAFIGDINTADTIGIKGAQSNGANAYIVFGNSDATGRLGRAGTGPLTYAGAFSATGNITGAALTGTSLTVSTGNITGGNLLLSGAIIDSAQLDIQTSAANANIALAPNGTGLVTVSTQLSAVGNVTGGNIRTAGLISATGAITGAALTGTSLTVGTGNLRCGNIQNNNGNGIGNIGNATGFFNTVFAKATSAQYADLAEMYLADADLEPGTVVVFGGNCEIQISTITHANNVAGVVSTNPSYLMNATQQGPHAVAVALTGRVPTRVIGKINKGDRMVSSHVPGVATTLDLVKYEPGCIIGKALTTHDPVFDNHGNEIPGIIEVVVGRL